MRRHGRTDLLLLYYFRTPPYVKVGRTAIDDEARARLERHYPDIKFEWDKILREPPQILTEQEATRRKDQRDAREARRKRKKPVEAAAEGEAPSEAESSAAVPELERLETPEDFDEDSLAESNVIITTDTPETTSSGTGDPVAAAEGVRKRRRRRRRRKREGEPGGNPPGGVPPADHE